MNLLKRVVPQLIMISVICLIAIIGYVNTDIIGVSVGADMSRTIIIDAGHGGFDGGASAADGTVEKDINLQISQKVCAMLRLNGYNVIMTRDSDIGTEDDQNASISQRKKSDLSNRLQLMRENPDAVFISIHLNKFTTSAANGAQVFYTKNYSEAYNLANSIQKSIITQIQPENTRVVKQGNSSTYLLKNATVPAIIVECGFLSNNKDLEKLKNDDYQTQMAFAITSGTIDYFKLKE